MEEYPVIAELLAKTIGGGGLVEEVRSWAPSKRAAFIAELEAVEVLVTTPPEEE